MDIENQQITCLIHCFFRIFKLDITIKNKTYGGYYNFIAGVFGSGQALEGRLRRIQ